MVFSSILFLFLFLPIVLVVYHLIFLPANYGARSRFWLRTSNLFLLISSLVFYGWGEPILIWVMVVSASIDYLAALVISGAWRRGEIATLEPGGPRTKVQKAGLVISLSSNLAFLGYFKYCNFGVHSYNVLVTWLGVPQAALHNAAAVALPIGISFYTFQSMSYTIDVYLGNATATRSYLNFATFVTLFPQLVAGPIVRYRDVAGMLVKRNVSQERFASGASRFIIGLGKKVLIANTVAVAADKIFALRTDNLNAGLTWLAVICYTIQIYFDFSGYSDMAIGMGRMLGFEFLENFNYPYISRSIQEFWRRWHMSLSTWFRDYLYIPLGGNRKGKLRTYLNLVTVFFLCGLWHGASWTFVIWGLYHGVFLVVERLGLGAFLERRSRAAARAYTLLVVMVGWVLFRSADFPQAAAFLAAMAGFGKAADPVQNAARYLTPDVAAAIVAGAMFSAPVLPALARLKARLTEPGGPFAWAFVRLSVSYAEMLGLFVILAESAMSLASGTHNPFIYFRF